MMVDRWIERGGPLADLWWLPTFLCSHKLLEHSFHFFPFHSASSLPFSLPCCCKTRTQLCRGSWPGAGGGCGGGGTFQFLFSDLGALRCWLLVCTRQDQDFKSARVMNRSKDLAPVLSRFYQDSFQKWGEVDVAENQPWTSWAVMRKKTWISSWGSRRNNQSGWGRDPLLFLVPWDLRTGLSKQFRQDVGKGIFKKHKRTLGSSKADMPFVDLNLEICCETLWCITRKCAYTERCLYAFSLCHRDQWEYH